MAEQPKGQPGERRAKRPYAKPILEEVEIVPQEAMLGFCKSTAGQPGAFSQCGNTGCSQVGS
jgi:hypothetical protein